MNIYIIDDDRIYAKELAENIELELVGNVFTISKNIKSIFSYDNFHLIDYFLVDKNLHNGKGSVNTISVDQIDGFELAKEIKEKNNNAKVILMSGDNIQDIIDSYNIDIDFDQNKTLFASTKDFETIINSIKYLESLN